jgi:hypothetical protein
MVVSSTTISWAVRMTNSSTEGFLRCRRSVPGGPPEGLVAASGRDLSRRVEGIDYDLSAGMLKKRKLPPFIIRRVPPFSKPSFSQAEA